MRRSASRTFSTRQCQPTRWRLSRSWDWNTGVFSQGERFSTSTQNFKRYHVMTVVHASCRWYFPLLASRNIFCSKLALGSLLWARSTHSPIVFFVKMPIRIAEKALQKMFPRGDPVLQTLSLQLSSHSGRFVIWAWQYISRIAGPKDEAGPAANLAAQVCGRRAGELGQYIWKKWSKKLIGFGNEPSFPLYNSTQRFALLIAAVIFW